MFVSTFHKTKAKITWKTPPKTNNFE